MSLTSKSLVVLLLGSAIAACGPSPGGKVPVDHPIYEYQPPEEEEPEEPEEPEEEEEEEDDAGEDA